MALNLVKSFKFTLQSKKPIINNQNFKKMENETNLPTENAKPATKGNVPAADIDFGKVATDVALAWVAKPAIALVFTTAAAFSTSATAYNAALLGRKQAGSTRPQITQALIGLDKQIDDALSYVKGYIVEKYKKAAATSYYSAFGIEYKTNKYVFPKDRNSRLVALDLMQKGLVDNAFGTKEFGTAFWTGIKTQYATLLTQASTMDGTVSTKVSSKNTLKDGLKKTMNSLILVLKGNYPDTYKAELRAWGFQKEKY